MPLYALIIESETNDPEAVAANLRLAAEIATMKLKGAVHAMRVDDVIELGTVGSMTPWQLHRSA